MKNCLFCSEEIQDTAIKCKHCGEWFKKNNFSNNGLSVGLSLKFVRQKRNISLKKLSELSGIQIATLSRMENNRTLGILKNYMSIAKALELKLSELFDAMEKTILQDSI